MYMTKFKPTIADCTSNVYDEPASLGVITSKRIEFLKLCTKETLVSFVVGKIALGLSAKVLDDNSGKEYLNPVFKEFRLLRHIGEEAPMNKLVGQMFERIFATNNISKQLYLLNKNQLIHMSLLDSNQIFYLFKKTFDEVFGTSTTPTVGLYTCFFHNLSQFKSNFKSHVNI